MATRSNCWTENEQIDCFVNQKPADQKIFQEKRFKRLTAGKKWLKFATPIRRVVSSAGRASPLQGEGRGFEPLTTHQYRSEERRVGKEARTRMSTEY